MWRRQSRNEMKINKSEMCGSIPSNLQNQTITQTNVFFAESSSDFCFHRLQCDSYADWEKKSLSFSRFIPHTCIYTMFSNWFLPLTFSTCIIYNCWLLFGLLSRYYWCFAFECFFSPFLLLFIRITDRRFCLFSTVLQTILSVFQWMRLISLPATFK